MKHSNRVIFRLWFACALVVGLGSACSVVLPLFGYPPHATRSTPPENIEQTVRAVSTPAPTLVLATTAGTERIDADTRPTALFFFRGHWCPYCNTQLEQLNERQADFQAMGVRLIGISADGVEDTAELKEELALGFDLASDAQLQTIKALGTLDAENEIAWPAIVVIRDGAIVYRWIAESTSERTEVSEIMRQMQAAL